MQPPVSVPAAFLERARREAERYGDDPWILLRELVQNSRDAGATRIAFRVSGDGNTEALSCEDDGKGMSQVDVTSYLLRLYASGKPAQSSAEGRARGPVGRFGVGFWSVLRFAPAIVRVESSNGEGHVAFEVDCVRRTLREVPCSLVTRGTRVTLLRPRREEPVEQLEAVVERGLLRWAGHVRGLSGGRPPQLTLNGRPLNRRFEPQGFVGERLKGSGFEGVVGLGPLPRVRLFAHGLLIREAGGLEELLPRRTPRAALETPGLYPVADINADGLEVLLDRQHVVEDQLLERIVRGCERSLARLQRRLLDRLAPLPLLFRARLALASRRARLGAGAIAVIGLGVGFGAVLEEATSHEAPVAHVRYVPSTLAPTGARSAPLERRAVGAAVDGAQGPRINTPPDAGLRWDLRVQGHGRHLLKIATYARYDEQRGLVSEPVDVFALYPPPPRLVRAPGLVLELGVPSSAEPLVLPVPAGHRVVPDTVRLDGAPIRGLGESALGEPVLFEPHDGGRIRYAAVPVPPAPDPRRPHVGAAPHTLPPALQALVDDARALPVAERARAITRSVTAQLRYTTDPADSARFDALRGSFVKRVDTLRAGDCDVINGLNVLLLRKAGIPARLAVGFVVEDGRVAAELHAWTEYYDGGWHVLDASPVRPTPPRGDAVYSAAPESAETAETPEISETPIAAIEAPSRPDSPAWPWVLALLGGLGLASTAGGALVARGLRARRHAASGRAEDEALVRMLRQFLKQPTGTDPLLLRRRPFFPTLSGALLSLAEVERLAERGRLLVGTASSRLRSSLSPRVPILDRADPRVAALLDRLPPFLDLDELSHLVERRAREPALSAVEAELRRLDPGVRVHAVPGAKHVVEVELPVRPRALAPRHLLVGVGDSELLGLLTRFSQTPRLVTFELTRLLLARTTLYANVQDELLAPLAEQAIREAAP